MKVEFVNPFYKATKDIFKLMLNIDLEKRFKDFRRYDSRQRSQRTTRNNRPSTGRRYVQLPCHVLDMIKIMSGMDINIIDNFASSALGEIGNIIGGNALTELSKHNLICNIIPPQVFVGEHRSLSLANQKALLLTLTTSIGEFDLSVFLKTGQ